MSCRRPRGPGSPPETGVWTCGSRKAVPAAARSGGVQHVRSVGRIAEEDRRRSGADAGRRRLDRHGRGRRLRGGRRRGGSGTRPACRSSPDASPSRRTFEFTLGSDNRSSSTRARDPPKAPFDLKRRGPNDRKGAGKSSRNGARRMRRPTRTAAAVRRRSRQTAPRGREKKSRRNGQI